MVNNLTIRSALNFKIYFFNYKLLFGKETNQIFHLLNLGIFLIFSYRDQHSQNMVMTNKTS